MNAKCDRQLYTRGTAWASDKDEVVAVFGFSKDLLHICAQHLKVNDCQMDVWQE